MVKKIGIVLFVLICCFRNAEAQPILQATGVGNYCHGPSHPIVSQMSIIPDPVTNDLTAVYIQISSGYQSGADRLILTGTHPNLQTSWNALTGKLELKSLTGAPLLPEIFENAVMDVHFQNNSPNLSGSRSFSITVGQANYLPSTDHYYRYIPNLGITWEQARIAAQNSNYYGLQGYLATIASAEEATLCGEQSEGAGWIGGSDAQQEGVWRWVTGPEAGTVFWNNGTTLTYANWNTGEPNNAGNENYAHVTHPGVGSLGAWNDLSNTGQPSGEYQPKGYIVEYGGMPGDPVLQISASTNLYIPQLNSIQPASRCGAGSVVLQAQVTAGGTVYWYDASTGGNLIHTGSTFQTPTLTESKNYYVSAYPPSCTQATRSQVMATIHPEATIQILHPAADCEGVFHLEAITPSERIQWYENAADAIPIATGSIFETPFLTESKTYYAEAVSDFCPSSNKVPVLVTVYPKPQLIEESLVSICEGSTVVLDSGLSGMQYDWNTGQNSRSITVNAPGIYTVVVTNSHGCSNQGSFTVLTQYPPRIQSVVVIGNQLEIFTENSGDFEYSIDGTHFQTSPIFSVDGTPIQQIIARESNNCGIDSVPFEATLKIPAFFTPNGDGFHDFWTINGLIFYPGSKIQIFDRYGKFLHQIDKSQLFWDGTFNAEALPSDDYWFTLDLNNGQPLRKGNFSLVR